MTSTSDRTSNDTSGSSNDFNNADSSNWQLPSHSLLILADSALPLGSFAFSGGLESYLAHQSPAHNSLTHSTHTFMRRSIVSLTSTTLSYLITAFRSPHCIRELDDELDACLLCPVARRASTSQGRALISVWERSLGGEAIQSAAKVALQGFCSTLKSSNDPLMLVETMPNAHYPIIHALVCAALGLSLQETTYIYLFNHAKAVAGAAVRAGALGPYAAQALLASQWVRKEIESAMKKEWSKDVKLAGQTVPALDIWLGRHEMLYSRIFNS